MCMVFTVVSSITEAGNDAPQTPSHFSVRALLTEGKRKPFLLPTRQQIHSFWDDKLLTIGQCPQVIHEIKLT